MTTIKYIALHHGGGLQNDIYAKSQHLGWERIDQAHKDRWNFISGLGFYGGYNFYISVDGTYKQFRLIGEETAAQIGYNFNCVSFCTAGNFIERNGIRIEQPTEAQIKTLKMLMKKIIDKDFNGLYIAPNTVIDVPLSSVHPHSFYQQTQCNCFPDAWGRELMKIPTPQVNVRQTAILTILDNISLLFAKLRAELSLLFQEKKLGRVDRGCDGII